jgi:hypothetical protein
MNCLRALYRLLDHDLCWGMVRREQPLRFYVGLCYSRFNPAAGDGDLVF